MALFVHVLFLNAQNDEIHLKDQNILCGADQAELYVKILAGKKVGLVGNKSSMVSDTHLLDILIENGLDVLRVFCPEHGFRGEAEAGALIDDHVDKRTGVQVISVYGSKKKPTRDDLKGIEVLVFDIQDVGARFYTYISTLHYIMEAAAENGIQVLILDRPNPNGFYIDGPIRDGKYESFVGMHPVPVVHGMTIGEYAKMINGEKWLANGVECEILVIPCKNYDHQTAYTLPIPPSPNLPNQTSVYLYPSLCFFEGTIVSIGRGTNFPFQVYGHPDYPGDFEFIPEPIPGASLNPKSKGQLCRGVDLRQSFQENNILKPYLQLQWIIDAYNKMGKPNVFFTDYFDTLAGTDNLRKQIQAGKSADEIRLSWRTGLEEYSKIRKKYLIYP